MTDREAFLELDEALIRLRRLWTAGTPRLGSTAGPEREVEMSTVLVADAVHRLGGDDATTVAEEPTVAAVGGQLDVTPSTASRLVDRAVTAGMVERGDSTVDPRRVRLTLTPQGEELVARATRFRLGYLESLVSDWSATDVSALSHLLGRFALAVRRRPPPVSDSTQLTDTHQEKP